LNTSRRPAGDVEMSCTRRHPACGGVSGDASRRAGSSALPPIVEERLLDTDEDTARHDDDDDDKIRKK